MNSVRGKEWMRFANEVADHIENYTVPQYGDEGDDIITNQTAEYRHVVANAGNGGAPK